MNKIFYIAEIGINHNGDINIAKKLIDASVLAGFDAVKFQKRTIDLVYDKELLDSHRESPWGTTQREQKEGLEFTLSDYKEIDSYCKIKNIEWFASAWDLESLNFLDQFNLKYHKVASAMIIDEFFLRAVAKKKLHTFISTGMSRMKDIEKAISIFREENTSFELMHCFSTYPMNPEDANLSTIKDMKQVFNCDVGYSGHENGLAVSYGAAMLGITSLERHITLDRTMYGSDQAASIEPKGMAELISVINKMHIAMGEVMTGKVLEAELPIAEKLRAHIIK
jgi:N-acetylneuraminate synthase